MKRQFRRTFIREWRLHRGLTLERLANRVDMDDYDRCVLMLLDDFASCMVMLGVLAGGESRRDDPKN